VFIDLFNPDDKNPEDIFWNPKQGYIEQEKLEQISPDVIINLSGEEILGIWTENKKKAIVESRIQSTKLLSESVSKLSKQPSVFISASGASYYGTNTKNEFVDESSPNGTSFLSRVTREWEDSIQSLHCRVVTLRIGLVLDNSGGFFGSMLPQFKFGLGGVMGTGQQYMSWISLTDLVRAIEFIIVTPTIEGPVNMVSINPCTNYQFTKTLGNVLWRPTICWIPEFVLKSSYWIIGDLVYETALANLKVYPKKID